MKKELSNILKKNLVGLILLKIYRDLSEILSFYRPSNIWSVLKIWKLKGKYKGKRCFIIGNGPSLKNTDLSLLKNEYTFGLNRIYLMFPRLGFQTSFYVCVNNLVISQIYEDINKLGMMKFISIESRKSIKFNKNTVFLRSVNKQGFPFDPSGGVWEGGTVTYVALQLAYYLGFSKVILVGVDHDFGAKGKPNEVVTSKGEDRDHFDPDYFGKGFKWQLPDLETSEVAFQIARREFLRDGREIIDATVNGKLKVFPKAKLEDLFK